MAYVKYDRVRQGSNSTGTGSLVLSTTLQGYDTFASRLSTGDTFHYVIVDGANFEIGIGNYTAVNTVARTTVLRSTNGNTFISLSGNVADVFIAPTAENTIISDANNLVTLPGNITTNDYYLGNGYYLSGVVTTDSAYGNANVAAYLPTYTGNLSAGNIQTTGNVATQNITAASILTSGNVTALGNMAAVFYTGNIRNTTGGYSNANVAQYLPVYTGNISAGNILSNNLLFANGVSAVGNANDPRWVQAQAIAVPGYTPLGVPNAYVANLSTATDTNVEVASVIDQFTFTFNGTTVVPLSAWTGFLANGVSNSFSRIRTISSQINGTVTTYEPHGFIANDSLFAPATGTTTAGFVLTSQGNAPVWTAAANIFSNANVANYLVSYTGNVGGGYYTGNITQAQGYYVYGNSNVGSYLETYTGNVAGGYYTGNITQAVGYYVYGNSNVANYLQVYGGNILAGNIQSNYFYANGQPLIVPYAYSNNDVANYLPTYQGNFSANNISVTNVVATGVLSGNSITGNRANITGNIQANYYLGNGYFLSGVTNFDLRYSNANVDSYLPIYQGNIAGGNLDIAEAIVANTGFFTLLNTASFDTSGNITANNLYSNNQLFVGSNATIAGDLTVSGNTVLTNVGNLTLTAPLLDLGTGPNGGPLPVNDGDDRGLILHNYGNGNVDILRFLGWDTGNGEFAAASDVTVSNNVVTIAQYGNLRVGNVFSTFYGNVFGNLTGANATLAANLLAGNALFNNNVVVLGNLSVLGNTTFINANTISINDKNITLANNTTNPADANGAGITVGANLGFTAIEWLYAANTWNFNSLNISVPGNVSATGNLQGNNFTAGGAISATGNVTANYIFGNITQATGYYIYGNSNVANYLPTYSGNISAGNISTTANVSAAGNVSANFLLGNGFFLSGIAANYGNSNVANFLAVYNGNASFSNTTVNASFVANGVVTLGSDANTTVAVNGRINSDVIPLAGNIFALGSTALPWDNIYTRTLTSSIIAATTANVTGNINAGNILLGNANITGNLQVANTNSNTANIANSFTLSAVGTNVANNTNYAVTLSGSGILELVTGRGNLLLQSPNINLGNGVGQVHIFGGTSGQYLQTNGAGNLIWANALGQVAGSNTFVQFNDNGNLNGVGGLTFDKNANTLSVGNAVTTNTILATGNIVATGNINTLANLNVSGLANITSNLTVGTVADGNSFTVVTKGQSSIYNNFWGAANAGEFRFTTACTTPVVSVGYSATGSGVLGGIGIQLRSAASGAGTPRILPVLAGGATSANLQIESTGVGNIFLVGNVAIGTTAGTNPLYAANGPSGTVALTAGAAGQVLTSAGDARSPFWAPAANVTHIYTTGTSGNLLGAWQVTATNAGNATIGLNRIGVTQSGGTFTIPAGQYLIEVSHQMRPPTGSTANIYAYSGFSTSNAAITTTTYGTGGAGSLTLTNGSYQNAGDLYTSTYIGYINIGTATNFFWWGFSSANIQSGAGSLISIEKIG